MTKINRSQLSELLAAKAGWSLNSYGTSVQSNLEFDCFSSAWGFMSEVAIEAEKMNHHPELSNVYNKVKIILTTHDTGGLSSLDLQLAKVIDRALACRSHIVMEQ